MFWFWFFCFVFRGWGHWYYFLRVVKILGVEGAGDCGLCVYVFFQMAGCHIGHMLLAFYQLSTIVGNSVLKCFSSPAQDVLIFIIKAVNANTVLSNFSS